MSTGTETALKELKTLINNRFDEIKIDLNNIDKRLTVLILENLAIREDRTEPPTNATITQCSQSRESRSD